MYNHAHDSQVISLSFYTFLHEGTALKQLIFVKMKMKIVKIKNNENIALI